MATARAPGNAETIRFMKNGVQEDVYHGREMELPIISRDSRHAYAHPVRVAKPCPSWKRCELVRTDAAPVKAGETTSKRCKFC